MYVFMALVCFILKYIFYAVRYLTEKVVPGNRVTIIGIYSIKKVFQKYSRVSSFSFVLRPCCELMFMGHHVTKRETFVEVNS